MKVFAYLLLASLSLVQFQSFAEGVDVKLTFTNVNNKPGEIYYAFYNSADSYNAENNEAITGKFPSVPGTSETVVHNVNPGTYALTAFHDENGNGKLDFIFGLIPKEQFGFSNVAYFVKSKPTFDDLKFDVKINEPNALTIYMRKH